MKKKKLLWSVIICFSLFLAVESFGADKTITDQGNEMLRQLDQMSKEAESWTAKQRAIGRQRYEDCIDAFGHEKFCSCLNKELHWVLSFESYIGIITTSPKEISQNLTPDERAAIDSVYKTRERCVKQHIDNKK